jgi:hypothetical protein
MDYLFSGPFVAPMTMRLFGRGARRLWGPAGSSICLDPYGLHRSLVPQSRPSLVLEIRFGTFFNEHACELKLVRDAGLRRMLRRAGSILDRGRRAQVHKVLERIPATARHQYVFRYLIEALIAER